MRLGALLRTDLARFEETFRLRGQRFSRARVWLESFVFKPGFQAVALYRVAHALHRRGWNYAAWLVARCNQWLTGAEIEFNARIGPGLFIAHPSGIVVGRGTRLGARTTLFQNVTFGARSWHPDEIRGFPQVRDNCFFCANAVVIGAIAIGDDCVIGAGSVVNRDLPAGALAVGVPAKVHDGRGVELLREWGIVEKTEASGFVAEGVMRAASATGETKPITSPDPSLKGRGVHAGRSV